MKKALNVRRFDEFPIQVGDTVRLKRGGTDMVVERLSDQGLWLGIICRYPAWTERVDIFSADSLIKIEKPEG